MMFRGGSLPQPISDDLAVALIVNQLQLGLKKYQDDKRVKMLNNPLQYLKARNAACLQPLQTQQVMFTMELYIR